MDEYVYKELNSRFEEVKRECLNGTPKDSKSVISLALRDYLSRLKDKDIAQAKLDPTFAEHATRQMRLFLFAGHDTTTSVLVYTYHMLSKYPNILKHMQEEHASIFGPDPRNASQQLTDEPSLLNRLPYTVAAIKESMRFYPPAGANKAGLPGVPLVGRHGTLYPTEGVHISIQHHELHHHPLLWPRVKEFLPERWLVEEGHELYPPAGAFRAFEHGPRNCIGQNLAMLELRVVLVLTVRRFEIKPAYEEWDGVRPKGWAERVGLKKREVENFEGERAYQVEKGAAHPKDGYPCRVTLLDA